MILVNLLPHDLRPVKRTPVPYMASALLVLVVLLGMGWMWMASLAAHGRQQAELDRYQEQLSEFGDVVNEYNKLEEQKVDLAEKIDIINEIVGDRIIWSKQLWNLSRLVPSNIWISGLAVKMRSFSTTRTVYDPKRKQYTQKRESVKTPVLEITGYVVPDEQGVMQFFPLTAATERDPEFSKLFKLEYQKREVTEFFGRPVLSFELTYKIIRDEEKKPEEKEKAG